MRARGWLILALVVIAVGVAYGLSLSAKKKYTATATFQLQDESRDFGLVGLAVAPTLTPQQLANQAAQTIQQPAVLTRVKQTLKSPLQPAQLATSVTAAVDTTGNLVHVTAVGPSATGASQLANAFANAAVRLANQNQRAAYSAAADQLSKRKPPAKDANATLIYNEQYGRLRTLASIAHPAQLTGLAATPGGPSSPKPVRNAAFAGLIGLMIGLLIVYVWDSLDRRLRSSGEVENVFGYPVVGRVRDEALGHSPNADDRDGAVEPLDWEQFRILRHNLQFLGSSETPKTIAVTSAMPQEGKTTVACFVAFAAAASGKSTLLIECDLRRSVLAERLGINASPGLTDFVNGTAEPTDLLQVVSFTDAAVRNGTGVKSPDDSELENSPLFRHKLVCITAGSPTQHPVEVVESAAFRAMLNDVRQTYDLVILDTPPVLPVVDALEVITNTEAVVVCGRAAQLRREQVRAFKQALDRVPDRPVGLVVTGIKPSGDYYGPDYYGYYVSERR